MNHRRLSLSSIWLKLPMALFGLILFLFFALIVRTVFAVNINSSLVVGNATPSVTAVSVNNATNITLSTNATTTVNVNFTVSDNNGCSDVFSSGSLSILLYRSSITSSSCNSSQNNMNCYKVTTSTNSCSGSNTSANATATFQVYYFADPTDASSSYSAQTWKGTVIATDSSASNGAADSSGVEVNTLVAIDVTTSSISYGTITAGTDTEGANQITTTTNAGNVTTTLGLNAQSTLANGGNRLATSSQRYATSSFTYSTSYPGLSDTQTSVSGLTLVQPTTTANVARATYWGVSVSSSFPTGTYTGVTVFSPVFVP